MNVAELAQIVTEAYFQSYEIEKLTIQNPLSLEQAYEVQAQAVSILESKGDRLVGWKMGLTSKAKMKQMGVHQPIYGALTGRMRLKDGDKLSLSSKIHPKIEPEIAFHIGRDIQGAVSPREALEACSGVCAAMEIIDSRYKNFDFTLPDVIADNCSSSSFVLGALVRKPSEIDLGNLGMVLEQDGKPAQFGSSAAIYGNPADSLAELCAMLHSRGLGLKAGQIVLAGAATAAIPLVAGSEFSVRVQDLGTCRIFVS